MEEKYVIFLPKEGINVEGYSEIPKTGATIASTPKEAVTHHVFSSLRNSKGEINASRARIICSELNKHGGLAKFAVIVPRVYSEDWSYITDYRERRISTEMALATEMALHFRRGKPEDYYNKSRNILDKAPFLL